MNRSGIYHRASEAGVATGGDGELGGEWGHEHAVGFDPMDKVYMARALQSSTKVLHDGAEHGNISLSRDEMLPHLLRGDGTGSEGDDTSVEQLEENSEMARAGKTTWKSDVDSVHFE
jgi:hypothetical protein